MWSCIIDRHADDSKYQENAIEISNCDIETAFCDLTISDHFLGVIVVAPQELLHLFHLKMVPYILAAVRETIGEKSNNASTNEFIHTFFLT